MSVRSEMFFQIVLVLIVGMFLLTGCARESIKISPQKEGYSVSMPKEMMKGFPDNKLIRIVIDDPRAGKTQVKGVGVQTSDNSFELQTKEKLKFIPAVESTKAAGSVWIMVSPVISGGTSCSGCPRAGDLKKWHGDGNYCWCWAE